MKRKFIIEGLLKEAPEWLKETPGIHSKIAYNGGVYVVENIIYPMELGTVNIFIEKIS
jgi:hypothetical protein